jgi:excisionase family DNA binding protein
VSIQLLTISQAAERLGISMNTVYKMISVGDLRAVDMAVPGARSSKTRVRQDDLDAFIEARTREVRAS